MTPFFGESCKQLGGKVRLENSDETHASSDLDDFECIVAKMMMMSGVDKVR